MSAKYFTFFMLDYLCKLPRPHEHDIELLITCHLTICRAMRLMDTSGLFFDSATCDDWCNSMELHNRTYQELALRAERSHERLYLIRPKHHALVELVLDVRATRRNPLHYSWFEDDDFLQTNQADGEPLQFRQRRTRPSCPSIPASHAIALGSART